MSMNSLLIYAILVHDQKFPCGIIVAGVLNSTYVVLITKYVLILKVVYFLFFCDIMCNSVHGW